MVVNNDNSEKFDTDREMGKRTKNSQQTMEINIIMICIYKYKFTLQAVVLAHLNYETKIYLFLSSFKLVVKCLSIKLILPPPTVLAEVHTGFSTCIIMASANVYHHNSNVQCIHSHATKSTGSRHEGNLTSAATTHPAEEGGKNYRTVRRGA